MKTVTSRNSQRDSRSKTRSMNLPDVLSEFSDLQLLMKSSVKIHFLKATGHLSVSSVSETK
jgi:hypothetical protein